MTVAGRRVAESIVRRHRIMERWLTDVLGLDWVAADEEAARLEHAVSEKVERRLYETLGRPRTCPHGNPIPGHSKASPKERRLATLQAGARAAISRVSEVAEREAPLLLAYLDERRLTPGRKVDVVEVDDIGRTIRIRAGKREVTLSHDTAAKLWVLPI
jgi:DtxR family Mn-dependent transcriptional regulator